MRDWTEFGVRAGGPVMSAVEPATFPPAMQPLVDEFTAAARRVVAEPLRGITSDGVIVPGLFAGTAGRTSTAALHEAAAAFTGSLGAQDALAVRFAVESEQRRTWFNVHPYVFRHGLMLGNLSPEQRRLALDLVRAALSARGFGQARDIMRLNGLLATLTASPAEFDEWHYFISIFGTPSPDQPWGWQLDGHHLNINCLVLGDDMVLTPTFMGSEPCRVTSGPLAGTEVFAAELQGGLDLIRSLGAAQQEKAVLYPSIMPGTLPPHLEHWADGRTKAGAFQDNIVLPYQGIRGDELSDAQRLALMTTLGVHLGWARPDHAAVRAEQVRAHLGETWFSWLGGTAGDEPFYYRIHSPVVLVEFDQHPGVALDIPEPSRHHIHTIIRTPNGGDYGADLLARHHARFDHGLSERTAT
jgi:Protein of unknown function (DUF3500)